MAAIALEFSLLIMRIQLRGARACLNEHPSGRLRGHNRGSAKHSLGSTAQPSPTSASARLGW
eukprot:1868578-Lingulodinium_polyedra.AAC.1